MLVIAERPTSSRSLPLQHNTLDMHKTFLTVNNNKNLETLCLKWKRASCIILSNQSFCILFKWFENIGILILIWLALCLLYILLFHFVSIASSNEMSKYISKCNILLLCKKTFVH